MKKFYKKLNTYINIEGESNRIDIVKTKPNKKQSQPIL